jgi:DNA-damage-inducible protein J
MAEEPPPIQAQECQMIPAVQTKSADVRLRVEPELKEEVVRILADAGLELSIAIRLFFKQVVAHGGLPFEVRQPNAATIRAMKQARSISKARFSSAKELFDDLEKSTQGKARHASTAKRVHKGVSKGLARASAQRDQSGVTQRSDGPTHRKRGASTR